MIYCSWLWWWEWCQPTGLKGTKGPQAYHMASVDRFLQCSLNWNFWNKGGEAWGEWEACPGYKCMSSHDRARSVLLELWLFMLDQNHEHHCVLFIRFPSLRKVVRNQTTYTLRRGHGTWALGFGNPHSIWYLLACRWALLRHKIRKETGNHCTMAWGQWEWWLLLF